jgi:NAD-dependent SIR2 family protein deacetylase
MIILELVILWYITKVYYTHTFKIILAKSELKELRCSHCGRAIYRSEEHIRAQNYCLDCQ